MVPEIETGLPRYKESILPITLLLGPHGSNFLCLQKSYTRVRGTVTGGETVRIAFF